MGVETQKIGELAGRVDLRLVRRLALPEQGGSVQALAARTREQIGGAAKNRGARREVAVSPVGARVEGGIDRPLHMLGIG